MGRLVFSVETGIQVHLPDPANDIEFDRRGKDPYSGLGERRPILYDEKERQAYVGNPGWYHSDVREHYELPYGQHDEGYFEGNPDWGNGDLEWYVEPPPTHPELVKALNEAGFQVPDKPGASRNQYSNMDWDDDVWAD